MYKRVNKIAEIIEAKINTAPSTSILKRVKRVYRGDPIIIPQSSLPAVTIRALQSGITWRGNIMDNRLEKYQIRLVFDIRDFLGDSNIKTVKWEKEATDFFLEENENDNCLKDSCIVSILRKNISLDNEVQLQTDLALKNEYTDARNYLAFESTLDFNVLVVARR